MTEDTAKPPFWKSIKVNIKGLVTVTFSEPFEMQNWSEIDSTVLDVSIIAAGYQDN